MNDWLHIRRVANGWVADPSFQALSEFTHVFKTPDELAAHVRSWAAAQTVKTDNS